MTFELGYIGRRIQHEYQPININAVPYMMTKGGQQFKNAYANVAVALGCAISTNACGANVPAPLHGDGVTANPAYGTYINSLPAQPFFTAAMNPSYCNGTFPDLGQELTLTVPPRSWTTNWVTSRARTYGTFGVISITVASTSPEA